MLALGKLEKALGGRVYLRQGKAIRQRRHHLRFANGSLMLPLTQL